MYISKLPKKHFMYFNIIFNQEGSDVTLNDTNTSRKGNVK